MTEPLPLPGLHIAEIVADRAFEERNFRDRSVILYGNATTNSLWQRMLKESPLVVERGKLRAGNREWTGEDVATLFLLPRPDSKIAMVAAVGGTGMAGLRLTDRLPYFTSGVAYPDWCVFDPAVLEKGVEGVLAAGYFGNDWRLESGESVYR